MSAELKPPQKSTDYEDPGAHELDSTDGSEDFVDASEGPRASGHTRARSSGGSPIPITRVERVDDEPAYGEVPGTSAYKLRTADAVPDEIEVVPEGLRSRSTSRVSQLSRPSTPGGTRIPKIVAEKIDPDAPSYGDVPGTAAYEMRKADATPDEIIKSPDSASAPANPFKASPTSGNHRFNGSLPRSEIDLDDTSDDPGGSNDEDDDNEGDEGFGDDFDDFEEGQEAEAGDDEDFGDFGEESFDGTQSQSTPQSVSQPPPAPQPQQPSIPIPDFTNDHDDLESIQQTCAPYLRALFSSYDPDEISNLPPPNQQIFLSERSVSLYTQLIAPPPLAPPNWLRSRIRRLFLVSLGVPVDLDEILPASKQKKLVLPSIAIKSSSLSTPTGETETRPSTDAAPKEGRLGKLKAGEGSDASLASTTASGRKTSRKKVTSSTAKDDNPPDFDVAAARRLAQTTQERIDGMSDAELKAHKEEVERANERGREYLGWWERKVASAEKEKEAFEGVIENLVSFARKARK